jgi:hypothetical protein
MSAIEREYQQALNGLAEELLQLSSRDLLTRPEYGIVTVQARGTDVEVGYWHYEFDPEKHHLVFKVERRLFLFFHRSYISGVVFGLNTRPRLMTPEECGEYD